MTVGINTPANADLSIIEKPADNQPPVLSVGTVLSALAGSGKDANSSLEKERKQKGTSVIHRQQLKSDQEGGKRERTTSLMVFGWATFYPTACTYR